MKILPGTVTPTNPPRGPKGENLCGGWTFSIIVNGCAFVAKANFPSAAKAKRGMRLFVEECNVEPLPSELPWMTFHDEPAEVARRDVMQGKTCDHPGYPICPCTEPPSWNLSGEC